MIVSVCLVGGSWFIPIMYYTRGVLGLIRKEAPDDESEHLCLPCYSNKGKQDGDDGLFHFLLKYICFVEVCFRFVSALPAVGKSVLFFI